MILYIATCQSIPQLKTDEQFLINHCAQHHIKAIPVVWNDKYVAWQKADAVLIRTIWDYHKNYGEFADWLNMLSLLKIKVINPVSLIQWNSHKFYLQQLDQSGISIPKALYISQNNQALPQSIEHTMIVKPAISATAYETYKVEPSAWQNFLPTLKRLNQSHDLLIQDFIPEIGTLGEWSLMYFNHSFSHAVLKRAKSGDFRVQAEYGGNYEPAIPPQPLINFGSKVLAQLPQKSMYARVDMIEGQSGPYLMELELIEPELFLIEPRFQQKFLQALLQAL